MKQLMTAAILAALLGAPAFAQSSGKGQKANLGRDGVLRDCNAEAAKAYPLRDSNWALLSYRACMTQHGESE
jgi:hypothetical protein